MLLHTCIMHCYSRVWLHHYIGKKGTCKDLLATVSTAVKNHRVDQITDDVHIKDSFLLVLQTPQLQKRLIKYSCIPSRTDAIYKKLKVRVSMLFVVYCGLNEPWHWLNGSNHHPHYETAEMIREGLQFSSPRIHRGNQCSSQQKRALRNWKGSWHSPPNLHQVYLWFLQRQGIFSLSCCFFFFSSSRFSFFFSLSSRCLAF